MSKRLLRSAGYSAFGFFALLVGLYITFPGDAVGQRLAYELRQRTDGKVNASFGEVSLYRLSGVEAENVRLTVGQGEGATPVTLDAVRGRLHLLPLLLLEVTFSAEVELRGATVSAVITPDDDGALVAEAEIERLNLATPPILPGLVGMPVSGVVDGKAELRWAQDPRRSSGQASLRLRQIVVGPGEPVSGFSLPSPIDFGGLELELALAEGELTVGRFAQTLGAGAGMPGKRPDVELRAFTADASMKRALSSSTFDACVAVKLDEGFLAKNRKFETVMDLATMPAPVGPGFRKDGEGFVHVSYSGSFAAAPKPRRRLCSEKVERQPSREERGKGRPPKGPRGAAGREGPGAAAGPLSGAERGAGAERLLPPVPGGPPAEAAPGAPPPAEPRRPPEPESLPPPAPERPSEPGAAPPPEPAPEPE